MSVQVHTSPNNPNSSSDKGAVKTPAPKQVDSRFGKITQGYGVNGPQPSSTSKPGETVTSLLADELKAAGTDGVLDMVIAKGTSKSDSLEAFGDVQDKPHESVKPYPTSFGMRNPNNANEKLPGALIPDEAEPVRKPSAVKQY
jgi:hypothetical protein